MKKENKILTIVKAFAGSQNIPQEVKNERLKICDGCIYNSKNADTSVVGSVRDWSMGHFCTACGCQIKEKTSVPYEECGLGSIGKKPLWNRLGIVTSNSSDFDIFIEESEYRLDLINDVLVIECYDVLQDYLEINLVLKKKREDIEYIMFSTGCASCSSIQEEYEGDLCKVRIIIDTTVLVNEPLHKNFHIDYVKNGNKPYTQIINVKFNNL